jgi:TolB-like protein
MECVYNPGDSLCPEVLMKRIVSHLVAGAMLLGTAIAGAAVVPNVIVRPFTSTGNAGAYDWVGKGIQQSLLADLSGAQGVQITFSTAQPGQAGQVAQEPGDSLAVAAGAGANLLVLGSYQINDNQVRITGEVYDVASQKNIGGMKATGPITDLFKLEDSLNDQLLRVLPVSRQFVNVPPPAPQVQDLQRPQTVTTDDGTTSLPATTVVSAPVTTTQYVYTYPSSSYCYYPNYYPYYSAPIYSCVSFAPIVRFPFCPRPVFFGGGFRGGFAFHGGGFVGFHGGGFGGGFHGGGGRR